jgi:teichuronic acid biosynthesis glycosyltransferase TuaC
MRALIVTNMYPTPARPALGSFVRDQVEALRRIDGVEVEVFAFGPGRATAYVKAARDLRRAHGASGFDVVHAHFGLTAWPAFAAKARAHAVTLHGTDLNHPRSRAITLAVLPFQDLVATVSDPLANQLPAWARRKHRAVLPAGVDIDRFRPIPKTEARSALGLDPDTPYLLFPADPRRPEKRYDRAAALAASAQTSARLLALGNIDPEEVPLWVNAVNAVLVPSERESFGLAVLEALACNVPVLATPVGIAPQALTNLDGTLCAPFDQNTWHKALEPHLTAEDPRIEGRARAEPYSTDRMAADVVAAWRALT